MVPAGRTDPLAELEATLAAYSAPWPKDTNLHARCRFPARYLWLSRQLELPGYSEREGRCVRLERWAALDRLRSASLLLVSGYFGNPASTFGHALLRLNTHEEGEPESLDVTVNFGALVPHREPMLRYVYRGLLGGYESGFSDRDFYREDLVYARTELRDLWDYELNLSKPQLRLLTFHLWEVIGRKFTYYFLTKNCGYRLAELMELATGESWLKEARVWYAPVEIFHRLRGLDRQRPGHLIRAVRFIPSSQRELRQQFASLTAPEQAAARVAIADGPANAPARLAALGEARRPVVTDALLAYYQYRLTAEGADPKPATTAAKEALLRERLRLPARADAGEFVPDKPSPAEGSAPRFAAAGLGVDAGGRHYAQLRFAAFSYDQIGLNALENGELVVADVAAGVDQRGRALLDRLDLIRVRKLNADRRVVPGEDSWSWQAQAGARRVRRDGRERLYAAASLGGGRAASWRQRATAYVMLDGSLQSGPSPLSIEPNVGLMLGSGPWKWLAQAGAPYDPLAGRWRWRAHGAARFGFGQDRALRLELDGEAQTRRAVASLEQHW
ncbi:MAG: DUF4105 domain-containing protein [Elusimicrobia bacterium]|nr:DUF4105 domain-containing protein [Elusimicrobiota bacterium]